MQFLKDFLIRFWKRLGEKILKVIPKSIEKTWKKQMDEKCRNSENLPKHVGFMAYFDVRLVSKSKKMIKNQ